MVVSVRDLVACRLLVERSARRRRRLGRAAVVRLLGGRRSAAARRPRRCALMSNRTRICETTITSTQSHEEQDRRVRHLVARTLDPVQMPLEHACAVTPRVRRRARRSRSRRPPGVAAEELGLGDDRLLELVDAARARSARGCWRSRRWCRAAGSRRSGTASFSALTSGIEPPVATCTVSLPQAPASAAPGGLVGRPVGLRGEARGRSRSACTVSGTPNGLLRLEVARRAPPAPRPGPAPGGRAGSPWRARTARPR